MSNNHGQSLARLQNLEVRLYHLQTKSHVRIGAGEGTADISAAENPLIRALIYRADKEKIGQAVRVPYLPGSSLHGVIRSWVEKALRSREEPVPETEIAALMQENEAFREAVSKEIGEFLGKEKATEKEVLAYWQVYPHVCNPLWKSDQCERLSRNDREQRQWKIDYWDRIKRQIPCAACDIFGYTGQRGRVKIAPAFPAASLKDTMPIDIITRVAINRLTGAADEGKLFDLEAIPPGIDFYFFVVMENMTPAQKNDFEKGIRAMNLQLAGVGAHSTIGFGMVDVNAVYHADIQPSIFDLELETALSQLRQDSKYSLHTPLDEEKYPTFFLALSLQDSKRQPPQAIFADHVTFQYR